MGIEGAQTGRKGSGGWPACAADGIHADTDGRGARTGRGGVAKAGYRYVADIQRRLFRGALQYAGPDQRQEHRFAHAGLGVPYSRTPVEVYAAGGKRNSLFFRTGQRVGGGCAVRAADLALPAHIRGRSYRTSRARNVQELAVLHDGRRAPDLPGREGREDTLGRGAGGREAGLFFDYGAAGDSRSRDRGSFRGCDGHSRVSKVTRSGDGSDAVDLVHRSRSGAAGLGNLAEGQRCDIARWRDDVDDRHVRSGFESTLLGNGESESGAGGGRAAGRQLIYLLDCGAEPGQREAGLAFPALAA